MTTVGHIAEGMWHTADTDKPEPAAKNYLGKMSDNGHSRGLLKDRRKCAGTGNDEARNTEGQRDGRTDTQEARSEWLGA